MIKIKGYPSIKWWAKCKWSRFLTFIGVRCGCSFPKSDRWYCGSCKTVHIWDKKTWADICSAPYHYKIKDKL